MILLSAALLARGAAYGQEVDSTDLLFDDAKVNRYELRFYTPNWADSLTYYKSVDEQYLPAQFVFHGAAGDSIVLDSIGVRYKGNSSYSFAQNSPKKPFKFRFDKYRKNQRFFGVERLNFSNGAKDPSLMREKIAYDIIRRYMPAPRACYATIAVAGELIGLYTQVEQVDEMFLDRHFGNDDGNLYKSGDDGAALLYKGQNQSSYESDYELKTNESDNDWSGFIMMLDKLNNAPASGFAETAGRCLNLDNCMRYCAFNMVLSNFDSYTGSGRNYYLYDDSVSGRFALIPWDLNLSFGAYANTWNVTTADAVNIPNLSQRPLARRLLQNDSLRQVYLGYIQDMMEGAAGYDSIAAMADRIKALIAPFVRADSNSLHGYADFLTNIESDVILKEGPLQTVIPGIKSFAQKRYANLRTQLSGYGTASALTVRSATPGNLPSAVTCCAGVNPLVRIRYTVGGDLAPVCIRIYACDGKRIASHWEGAKPAGTYERAWDTRALIRSGLYVIKVHSGAGNPATNRIMILR